MPVTLDKEDAFADLVKNHEDQWVAIIERDGIEFVVASGSTAVEAVKNATEHGHPQARLFKVPAFNVRFVY